MSKPNLKQRLRVSPHPLYEWKKKKFSARLVIRATTKPKRSGSLKRSWGVSPRSATF